MKYGLLAATALSAVLLEFSPQAAFADAETDALKAEVKALEARINDLEKREKQQAVAAAPVAAPAAASTQKLDQRLAIVERNQELAQEDAVAKAATTPSVDISSGKGFTISSADKQYSLNLRGYFQADDRTFLGNSNTSPTSTFLIRSARPVMEAKITDYFNSRFMVDFGKGNTTLLDAYGDVHPVPGNNLFNLRVGEFKVPIGIERWQGESDVLFVERGQTTNLVPYRDIGVMAYGQVIPDQLEYYLGVTNGASDLQANTGDTDNTKDVVGRVFAYPFRWAGLSYLDGLGFGAGGTYGRHLGNTGASNLTTGYVSTGQRTYFTYSGGTYADGPQWRLNPYASYYNGPLGVMAEYVINDQQVANSTHVAKLRNDAGLVSAEYVLTGEDASFEGVKPLHNFNPNSNEWGAFEVVGRWSRLDVDRSAFTFFANSTASSRQANESTIGGTWYFNPAVKLNLDFAYTTFEGGGTGGTDHEPEKAVLTRTQFRF